MLVQPRRILENIRETCPNPEEFLRESREIFRDYADVIYLRYLQEQCMSEFYLLDVEQTQWYFDQEVLSD